MHKYNTRLNTLYSLSKEDLNVKMRDELEIKLRPLTMNTPYKEEITQLNNTILCLETDNEILHRKIDSLQKSHVSEEYMQIQYNELNLQYQRSLSLYNILCTKMNSDFRLLSQYNAIFKNSISQIMRENHLYIQRAFFNKWKSALPKIEWEVITTI